MSKQDPTQQGVTRRRFLGQGAAITGLALGATPLARTLTHVAPSEAKISPAPWPELQFAPSELLVSLYVPSLNKETGPNNPASTTLRDFTTMLETQLDLYGCKTLRDGSATPKPLFSALIGKGTSVMEILGQALNAHHGQQQASPSNIQLNPLGDITFNDMRHKPVEAAPDPPPANGIVRLQLIFGDEATASESDLIMRTQPTIDALQSLIGRNVSGITPGDTNSGTIRAIHSNWAAAAAAVGRPTPAFGTPQMNADGYIVGGPDGSPQKALDSRKYVFPTMSKSSPYIRAEHRTIKKRIANTVTSVLLPDSRIWIFDTCPVHGSLYDNMVPPRKSWISIDNGRTTQKLLGDLQTVETECYPYAASVDEGKKTRENIEDHGLFIASLIHGIAPNSSVQVVRVLNNSGASFIDSLLTGLAKLERQLNDIPVVVNLSLTVKAAKDSESQNKVRMLYERIQHLATTRRVYFVAAAGNDSDKGRRDGPGIPARWPNVLSVAAVGSAPRHATNGRYRCKVAPYSNNAFTGEGVNNGIATLGGIPSRIFGAQGSVIGVGPDDDPVWGVVSIYQSYQYPPGSTKANKHISGYASWAGTSFATAVISALAANFVANAYKRNVSLTSQEFIQQMQRMPGMYWEPELNCMVLPAYQI